jgi:effector-binding domain-containing protein
MPIERVQAVVRPMLAVPARLDDDIGTDRAAAAALSALQRFLAVEHIAASGAPLIITETRNGTLSGVRAGISVDATDLAKAGGAVEAGETPGGWAARAVHYGSREGLPMARRQLADAVERAGAQPGRLAWEVYYGVAGAMPEGELVTELFIGLRD